MPVIPAFTSLSSCSNSKSVAFTGAANFCNGTPVTGATYQWNFGDNQTSGLQNPTHVYTTPGTYTVTFIVQYNGNNYVQYQQITVAYPQSITGFLSLCGAESKGGVYSVQYPNPGHTYTWSMSATIGAYTIPVTYTTNSSGSIATVSNWSGFLSLLTTYQNSQNNSVPTMRLCVTDATCGTVTCVTISGCCNRGPYASDGETLGLDFKNVTLVPYGTAGATAFPASNTLTPITGTVAIPSNGIISENIYLFGTLNVNTNVTFNYSGITANEAAVINITSSKQVTIQDSRIKGCVNMWSGIVNNGDLTINNSDIHDARQAIYNGALSTSKVKITNSAFNRNQVAIQLQAMPTTTSSFYLKGVLFTSREITNTSVYNALHSGNLATQINPTIQTICPTSLPVKGSPLMNIPATQRSSYGLYVNSIPSVSTINIGQTTTTSLTNTFDNLEVAGVYLRSSNATIVNNVFKNSTSAVANNASGILIENPTIYKPSITIGFNYSTFNPTSNTFSGLKNGIIATSECKLVVQSNQFTSVSGNAISLSKWYAASPAQKNAGIYSNGFTNCRYDVYASDNASINVGIFYNRSTFTSGLYATPYNVYINELNKPVTAVYNVSSNIFSGKPNGVSCQNVYSPYINSNTITINYPSGYGFLHSAIWLNNTDRSMVNQNTIDVSPSNSGNWYTMGIYTKYGTDNLYSCNNIKRTGLSMRFDGACPSKIYKNDFSSLPSDPSAIGILVNYGYTGFIGVPYYLYTGPKGMMGCGENIFGNFNTADTYTMNNSAGAAIYYPGTASASNPYYPVTNMFGNPAYFPAYSPITGLVGCSGSPSSVEASWHSDASAAFFTPGLDFGDNTDNTYTIARKGIYEMIKKDDVSEAELEGADAFMLSMELSTVKTFYDIDAKVSDYVATGNVGVLLEAVALNNALVCETPIDINQKTFNSVLFEYLQLRTDTVIVDTIYDAAVSDADTLLTDTTLTKVSGDLPRLSDQSIDVLKDLAAKCPITDGSSVYQARALLKNFDDAEYANPCEDNVTVPLIGSPVSTGINDNGGGQKNLSDQNLFSLYPNPAANEVTINAENAEFGNAQFLLYNLMGQEVLRKPLEGQLTISLKDLADGSYIYKIITGERSIKTDKLIIVR
jgi:hypothetical protein